MSAIHDLDLRKLRHATVLAAERNFSRAARKLNLTQSALSRSISTLEQELGLKLFDRNPGDIAVTTTGKEFIERSNGLLRHARGLSQDMLMLRDGFAGNVAFGMGSFPAAALLQDVLTELVREHPGINASVEVTTPDQLLEHLAAEDIEFFISDSRYVNLGSEFVASRLLRLRTSLFVRPGHPLVVQGKHKDWSKYPVITTTQSRKPARMPQVSCDNMLVLKAVAAASDAVLIAPYAAVAAECEAGTMQELRVPTFTATYVNFDIVRPANRSESPAEKIIFGILERIAAKYA